MRQIVKNILPIPQLIKGVENIHTNTKNRKHKIPIETTHPIRTNCKRSRETYIVVRERTGHPKGDSSDDFRHNLHHTKKIERLTSKKEKQKLKPIKLILHGTPLKEKVNLN